LKGNLVAEDYEANVASDPRVDVLRELMSVEEDERYSREYHEEDKRSIANAIQIHFKDGSTTEKVEVEYPIGHKFRRAEGMPLLQEKFAENLSVRFPATQVNSVLRMCNDSESFDNTPVQDFMSALVI
jgi:2-methylcitrate dehydratase